MSETTVAPVEMRVYGIGGLPEIQPHDDVPALIAESIAVSGLGLLPDDVIVVTHKIVSKAEGRLVDLTTVEPSAQAREYAETWGKDARQVEVVLREARRISRMERGIIIAETTHGFICANAGVDASNVAPETVCLLPDDPDGSAAEIRSALLRRFGITVGVIVSDSFGRPWRNGIVNVAIGVAGLAPLADYRGQHDAAGYELRASILAVADELAGAAELVMHKLDQRPVALIRGYAPPTAAAHGTGKDLVMPPERDLYR
jgi:coenzyme F420-0:L-glutamate ligase/coenzyme F420-1:gamma-L-glutamate ligase